MSIKQNFKETFSLKILAFKKQLYFNKIYSLLLKGGKVPTPQAPSLPPLKTLTTGVSEQMLIKLQENGAYHNSHTMGLDPKCTALAMAIVRLFYTDGESKGQFQPMKLGGIMCMVADRRMHSRFMRLYDINTSEMLFQCELYVNFHRNYRQRKHFQVKDQQSKVGVPSYNITKPLFFEKKEHAGWDPKTQTFILNDIPKEIKTLLKKAGFKKKDLKSKETALAIYEILLREVEYDAMQATRSIGNFGLRSSGNLNNSFGRTNLDDSRVMSISNFQQIVTQQDFMGGSGQAGGFNLRSTSLGPAHEEQKSAGKNIPMPPSMINNGLPPPSMGGVPQPLGMPPAPMGMPPAPMGIPPPPMGIPPPPPPGFPPPPGPPGAAKIPAPPGGPGSKLLPPPSAPQAPVLSLAEQLAQKSQNLKKVQTENQINSKVKNLSQSQHMQITKNLHAVLEQRKKLMMNDDKGRGSDEDSGDDGNESDGSAW